MACGGEDWLVISGFKLFVLRGRLVGGGGPQGKEAVGSLVGIGGGRRL
jgi:hypothetical protein